MQRCKKPRIGRTGSARSPYSGNVGGFAFQETSVLQVLPNVQRQLPGASTTSSAPLVSGFPIMAAVTGRCSAALARKSRRPS